MKLNIDKKTLQRLEEGKMTLISKFNLKNYVGVHELVYGNKVVGNFYCPRKDVYPWVDLKFPTYMFDDEEHTAYCSYGYPITVGECEYSTLTYEEMEDLAPTTLYGYHVYELTLYP